MRYCDGLTEGHICVMALAISGAALLLDVNHTARQSSAWYRSHSNPIHVFWWTTYPVHCPDSAQSVIKPQCFPCCSFTLCRNVNFSQTLKRQATVTVKPHASSSLPPCGVFRHGKKFINTYLLIPKLWNFWMALVHFDKNATQFSRRYLRQEREILWNFSPYFPDPTNISDIFFSNCC
jgi:hypothetical protein